MAAYLTEKAHSVSVVELEEMPFRKFLGERVGRALMKVSHPSACPLSTLGHQSSPHPGLTHCPSACLPGQMFENNRVKFYMQTEVSELRAQEGKVGFSVSLCFPVLRSWAQLLTHPSPPASGGGAEEQQGPAGRCLRGRHR